jgi:hypothetical protein
VARVSWIDTSIFKSKFTQKKRTNLYPINLKWKWSKDEDDDWELSRGREEYVSELQCLSGVVQSIGEMWATQCDRWKIRLLLFYLFFFSVFWKFVFSGRSLKITKMMRIQWSIIHCICIIYVILSDLQRKRENSRELELWKTTVFARLSILQICSETSTSDIDNRF